MAGKERSWYMKHCGIGVSTGLAAWVLLCMLFAYLTVWGIVPETWAGPCVYASVFLSSLCACALSAQGTVKRTVMILVAAGAYLLALVLIGLLACDVLCIKNTLYLCLSTLLGAALSMIKKQKGRGGKRKNSGEHNRKRRSKR